MGRPTEARGLMVKFETTKLFFRRMHVTEDLQDNDLVANWGPMRPQSQQIDISMALAGKDALPPPGGFH